VVDRRERDFAEMKQAVEEAAGAALAKKARVLQRLRGQGKA